MELDDSIFVAGHRGMVGSAICRALGSSGHNNVLTSNRGDLDLENQSQVDQFFSVQKPKYVFLAAAKVGGIHANSIYPADFIYRNLMIQCNVIRAAKANGVSRLLFLGSSCIYPKLASQPISESDLLSGQLEPSNEPYAVAKIAGIKLCESYNRQFGTDFRSIMPTNLYGPNDNFDLETSHVLPALLRRFYQAKLSDSKCVEVWGTGKAQREFLHVEDMADAAIHVMCLSRSAYWSLVEPMCSHLNVGTGTDVTIAELAGLVSEVTGFRGETVYLKDKPDGTPRKVLDVSLISKSGWTASIGLEEGLKDTYEWMVDNWGKIKGA